MNSPFFTPGRLAIMLGTAAFLVAMPVTFGFDAGSGLIPVKAALALAKSGSDDTAGGDDSDSRGDDNGGERGDDDGRGDGEDRGDDDGRGDGDGDDDGRGDGEDGGDDNGGDRGEDDDGDRDDDGEDGGDDSDDDNGESSGSDGSTDGGTGESGVTKIEVSGSDVEVTFSDGTRQEIENGRFERKDMAGRTVEERPATQADLDRLLALR